MIRVLFMAFFISSAFLTMTYAQESMTLTTFYPSPIGIYDRLRLVPRNALAAADCDATHLGIIYYENNNNLQICEDNGAGGGRWSTVNIWARDANTETVTLTNFTDKIALRGNFGSGPNLALTGDGSKFIWDPKKAAIRAGYITAIPSSLTFNPPYEAKYNAPNTLWDNASIGSGSVAFGFDNAAKSDYSAALSGRQNLTAGTEMYGVVAGGVENHAYGRSAFIGGGTGNKVYARESVVVGGLANFAGSTTHDYTNLTEYFYATVVGGKWNEANSRSSFVGGGEYNKAGNGAGVSGQAITGGIYNVASGDLSFVGGGGGPGIGLGNQATGDHAIIVGGASNIAGGNYSFSSGKNMQLGAAAKHTFVWGYSDNIEAITAPDAFIIFPAATNPGSVGINTANPQKELDVTGDIQASGTICDGSGSCVGYGGAVMYLRGGAAPAAPPALCPNTSGWTQADVREENVGAASWPLVPPPQVVKNNVRTCWTDRSCSVMYLRGAAAPAAPPALCPNIGGWTQADVREENVDSVIWGGVPQEVKNDVRTCYRCP